MGFLDRLFRRGRGGGGGGSWRSDASTTPIFTSGQTGHEGGSQRESDRDEAGKGEGDVGPASQEIEIEGSGGGDSGDSGGGDSGGGDSGGGGNGGGGGE